MTTLKQTRPLWGAENDVTRSDQRLSHRAARRGHPPTLNAVATINEVFRDHGIELPLPAQGTVSDAERYSKGLAEQAPLYGDEIKDNLADLPEPFNDALPRFLTEFGFVTSTPGRDLPSLSANSWFCAPSPRSVTRQRNSAPTAAPVSRWATPRPS